MKQIFLIIFPIVFYCEFIFANDIVNCADGTPYECQAYRFKASPIKTGSLDGVATYRIRVCNKYLSEPESCEFYPKEDVRNFGGTRADWIQMLERCQQYPHLETFSTISEFLALMVTLPSMGLVKTTMFEVGYGYASPNSYPDVDGTEEAFRKVGLMFNYMLSGDGSAQIRDSRHIMAISPLIEACTSVYDLEFKARQFRKCIGMCHGNSQQYDNQMISR